jgi:Holliday junction resolvase RusA-like endonuclease
MNNMSNNRKTDMRRCDHVVSIAGSFPSTNDIIRVNRAHPLSYGVMKEKYCEIACEAIESQIDMTKCPLKRIEVVFVWYEVRKFARDPDNIQGGDKFIMDALVESGVIKDDSLIEVAGIRNHFVVIDGKTVNDRSVKVGIKEVDEL